MARCWTPRSDVFELEAEIRRFDRYPEGSIIFAQLGVLNNLTAALSRLERGADRPGGWYMAPAQAVLSIRQVGSHSLTALKSQRR
jgi:hypothetical protein